MPGELRLGVDLVRPDRLARLIGRPWFTRYIYAEPELRDAAALRGSRRLEFLAGRYAAKEAVLKVLGVGLFEAVAPRDILLRRARGGRPAVVLTATAQQAAGRAGMAGLTATITHGDGLVVAVAAGW
jgi:holo-[acyl-carrier protein] synthase